MRQGLTPPPSWRGRRAITTIAGITAGAKTTWGSAPGPPRSRTTGGAAGAMTLAADRPTATIRRWAPTSHGARADPPPLTGREGQRMLGSGDDHQG